MAGEVLNSRFLSPSGQPPPGLRRCLRIRTELSEFGDPVPTGGLICGDLSSGVPTVAASMGAKPPWMGD
eukprot:10909145-Alexandrium_andersonii.AAC.1